MIWPASMLLAPGTGPGCDSVQLGGGRGSGCGAVGGFGACGRELFFPPAVQPPSKTAAIHRLIPSARRTADLVTVIRSAKGAIPLAPLRQAVPLWRGHDRLSNSSRDLESRQPPL